MQRQCNGCTACCKTHKVSRINKFEGQWCIYCSIGQGCIVYDHRPPECRKFECQWLKGYGEESDRPDRRKVILDFNRIQGRNIASLWEFEQGALETAYAEYLKNMISASGISVLCVYLTGREVLFNPED